MVQISRFVYLFFSLSAVAKEFLSGGVGLKSTYELLARVPLPNGKYRVKCPPNISANIIDFDLKELYCRNH